MTTVKIDDQDYELDEMSAEAKAQLESLRMCDIKIAEAQQNLAILQTARIAYATALRELISEGEADD